MARRRKKIRTTKRAGDERPKELPPSPTPHAGGRRSRWFALAALAFAGGLGVWALMGESSFEARPLNLVVITADTLRADKLGSYGNRSIPTPNLDRLAAEGVLFEQASTTAPITLPAHASIFTGTYPIFHGVRDNGARPLAAERTTLAEVLKAQGYATGAFVGAFVLDSRFGLDQGFDRYFDDFEGDASSSSRRGDEVLQEAITWMESVRGGRFFSWLHLFDPHIPYDPPEPFRSHASLYDGEVAYLDSLVGKLLQWLEDRDLAEETLVLFVADHGESLGDHGELTHGFFLYDETMRVPLLLRGPYPSFAGRRIAQQVRVIDLMPTVLDLLGMEPPPEVQGENLVPLLTGDRELELVAYGESRFPAHYGWSPLESLRAPGQLFVRAPRPELYDLHQDPGASENLAPHRAATVRELESRIEELRERHGGETGETEEPAPLDEESRARLTALGYLSASSGAPRDPSAPLADPKDKIDLFNRIREASADFDAGRLEDAVAKMEAVAAEDPEIVEAHNLLGRFHSASGDQGRAAESYRRALALDDSYVPALLGLATTYHELGRLEEAEAGAERVLAIEPQATGASFLLARLRIRAGRFAEALSVLEELSVPESERAELQELLAQSHAGAGNLEAAIAAYQELLAATPGDPLAHFNLAKLLGQVGREEEMVAHLEKSIEVDPGFAVGHLYLANTYLDRGNLERALELAKKGIELGPEPSLAPFGHFILADVYGRMGRNADAAREMAIARRLQGS